MKTIGEPVEIMFIIMMWIVLQCFVNRITYISRFNNPIVSDIETTNLRHMSICVQETCGVHVSHSWTRSCVRIIMHCIIFDVYDRVRWRVHVALRYAKFIIQPSSTICMSRRETLRCPTRCLDDRPQPFMYCLTLLELSILDWSMAPHPVGSVGRKVSRLNRSLKYF